MSPPRIRVAVLACLSVCCALPALAQSEASQNCRKRSVAVPPGVYRGEWEVECTLQGGAKHANMALALRVKGDLTLTVVGDELVTSADSYATSSFGGEGKVAGLPAASTQEGKHGMSLTTERGERSTARYFLISASGQGSGAVRLAGRSTPRSGTADLSFRFTLSTASCGVLDGEVRSKELRAQMEAMSAAGYQVTWTKPGRWQATIEGHASFEKRREELRQELERAKASGQGYGYTRDAEGRALLEALERLKKEKEPLRSCLNEMWSDWFQDRSVAWVEEDIRSLKGSHTDGSKYEERLARLVSSVRQFGLLGCDACFAEVQDRAWTAMQREIEDRLLLLVKHAATAEDLLALLRKAELLGQISPAARARVSKSIQEVALKTYHSKREAWRALYAAGKDQPPRDEERAAYRQALSAREFYQTLGGGEVGRDDVDGALARYQ